MVNGQPHAEGEQETVLRAISREFGNPSIGF